MYNMLEDLICHAFKKEAGLFQDKVPQDQRKALLVTTKTNIDHNKEEGYRYAEMVVYAGQSYVQVWARTRWNVAELPPEDVDWDDHDWKYVEGASEWKLLSHHDSCWREVGVRGFFMSHKHSTFAGTSEPYKVIGLDEVEALGINLESN